MPEQNKYLFCKKCGDYPDDIYEIQEILTKRKWNGVDKCYEGFETEYNEEEITAYCSICDTELIEVETIIGKK